jgi:hypothetical protein
MYSWFLFDESSILQRRRRITGYPVTPAQIPACGFPAPGSSIILTHAEVQAFTQAPRFISALLVWLGAGKAYADSTRLIPSQSGFAFDSFDSTTCRAI